jgi:hypothetical protein
MKAPRGSGLPTHHSKLQHGGARGLLGRFCWASVGPFLAALLLGSVLFRAGGGSGSDEFVAQRGNHRSVLEDSRFPTGCLGSNCGHGSLAGGGVGAQSHVQSSPLESGSSGAGSPQGELPQLFLFIGILSGRGYRHRRLAVREAWSNRAQVPGQVVARFILSEDERTPQVCGAQAKLCAGCLATHQQWVLVNPCSRWAPGGLAFASVCASLCPVCLIHTHVWCLCVLLLPTGGEGVGAVR